MATTAGRRVPLASSGALGAADSAFLGEETLRFGADFGMLAFSADGVFSPKQKVQLVFE